MRLKGKTALISGAGRNNGKAIALKFASEGANVVLVSRQLESELRDTARECEAYGVKVLSQLADVSNYENVELLTSNALERFGNVDILVNVVGIRPHKLPWEYSCEEWHQVFAVNVHSTFYFAKALAPRMIEHGTGGSIIALGGLSALTTSKPTSAGVVASKHALYGLIKALAHALGPHNIRANLLALGNIENKRLNPEWYADSGGDPHNAAALKRGALKRWGTQQEVANAALFLASDESSYITGDRIVCGGGAAT